MYALPDQLQLCIIKTVLSCIYIFVTKPFVLTWTAYKLLMRFNYALIIGRVAGSRFTTPCPEMKTGWKNPTRKRAKKPKREAMQGQHA